MTKIHALKTLPEYYRDVVAGVKTFEIRKNDRGFQVGDALILREFDPETGYTGDMISRNITYITDFAQQAEYVVMGIEVER